MFLKNAGQFRKFNSLSVSEAAALARIDESDYILIEELEKEPTPSELGKLTALYNVTDAELSGCETEVMQTPKKDVWHFFPPEEESYRQNISFDGLDYLEKELIAVFRLADSDSKEAVFKMLTDKTFAKRLIEAENSAQLKTELERLKKHLDKREHILDERERAILRILFDEDRLNKL